MNSSFCLSGKIFLSLSILNDSFARYSWLKGFYPFSTLNILCQCLLVYKISAEKSAVSLMGVPLYITSCFCLTAFNILSLSLTFDILILVCLGVSFSKFIWFATLWVYWIQMSVSFTRYGKFSPIISSNKISAPFSLYSFSGKLLYVRFVITTKQKPIVNTHKIKRKEYKHTTKESH